MRAAIHECIKNGFDFFYVNTDKSNVSKGETGPLTLDVYQLVEKEK